MSENTHVLMRRARTQLNIYTNTALAEFLGVSRRTVQRHLRTGGIPDGAGQDRLLKALHPEDPALAQALAEAWARDLASLGLTAVPPSSSTRPEPPAAPARPAPGPEHAAAVILAASDALGLLPRDVRPAIAAIFKQVRGLGVDLDKLTALLAEAPEPPKR